MNGSPPATATPVLLATASAVVVGDLLTLSPLHLWYAGACTCFGVVAALGRDLFWWEVGLAWQRRLGSIIVSLVAAWLCSLTLWGRVEIPLNLAISGACAYLGAEGASLVARSLTSGFRAAASKGGGL